MEIEEILEETFDKEYRERHESCKKYDKMSLVLPLDHQKRSLQLFIKSQIRGMLFYHTLGAGKTCTSIMIIDRYIKRYENNRVFILTTGSLRENYIKEYCTKCGSYREDKFERFNFITTNDRGLVRHGRIPENFDNSIIVIDEVHNVIRGVLNKSPVVVELYKKLYEARYARFILLSGTPIYTHGQEDIYYILHLTNRQALRGYPRTLEKIYPPKKKKDEQKQEHMALELFTDDFLLETMKGSISHVSKIGSGKYPTVLDTYRFVSNMTKYQLKSYIQKRAYEINILSNSKLADNIGVNIDSLSKSSGMSFIANTRLMSRQVLNFCYPPDIQTVLDSNTKSKDNLPRDYPDATWITEDVLNNLKDNYSPKFYDLIENIEKNDGKHLVYSFFKTRSGVHLMHSLLTKKGISCSLYTGGQTDRQKKKILEEYNSVENLDGNIVKVILITAAGTEGINLIACRNVHITEPTVNGMDTDQIIGRAVRYGSHDQLPPEKKYVKVFRYVTKLIEPIGEWVDVETRDFSEITEYMKEKKRQGIDVGENDMTLILLKQRIPVKKKEIFVSELTSSDEEIFISGNERKSRCANMLELMKRSSLEYSGPENEKPEMENVVDNIDIPEEIMKSMNITEDDKKMKSDVVNEKVEQKIAMDCIPEQNFDYYNRYFLAVVLPPVSIVEGVDDLSVVRKFEKRAESMMYKQHLNSLFNKIDIEKDKNEAVKNKKRLLLEQTDVLSKERLVNIASLSGNYNIDKMWICCYEILFQMDIIEEKTETYLHFDNDHTKNASCVKATHHFLNTVHKKHYKYEWFCAVVGVPEDEFGLSKNYPSNWLDGLSEYNRGENVEQVEKFMNGKKVNLYTANFNLKYKISEDNYLEVLEKVISGLIVLKIGGDMIVKIPNPFDIQLISLIGLITDFFETVYLTKPLSSDMKDNELFLVCIDMSYKPRVGILDKIFGILSTKNVHPPVIELNYINESFLLVLGDFLNYIYSLQSDVLNDLVKILNKSITIQQNVIVNNKYVNNFVSEYLKPIVDFIFSNNKIEKITETLEMDDTMRQKNMEYKDTVQMIFPDNEEEKPKYEFYGELLDQDIIDAVKKIYSEKLDINDIKNVSTDLEYRAYNYEFRTSMHIGQRKLLMSEVQFLSLTLKKEDMIIVYVGAAHGIHIPYLSLLFYHMNPRFILYDPAEFKLYKGYGEEILSTIEIRNKLFMDEDVEEFKNRDDILFISDIRSSDKYIPFERVVDMQMRMQEKWVKEIKPEASMLKFRLPYDTNMNTTYKYLKGTIYPQCWAPLSSTETRLISMKDDILLEPIDYNPKNHESKMYYINNILREWAFFNHKIPTSVIEGLDHSYDCSLEISIWEEYGNYVGKQDVGDIIDYINKATKTIGRGIKSCTHGYKPEVLMKDKRMELRRKLIK